MKNRVVVTGVGPVTPIGSGRENFWNAALAGTDGSGEVQKFDTSIYRFHRACEVKNFVAPKLEGDPGPATGLAVVATELALQDAGLELPLGEVGLVIGTTGGEIPVLEHINRVRFHEGEERVDRFEFLKYPVHVISTNVARHFGFTGPNVVVPTACAAGNYAVAIARDWLQSGRVDMVLAGGVDPLSTVTFTGFGRMFAIAPDRCRPFDKNRKGITPGEGAAMLVLETLQSAKARGAKIYAEVAGAGFSCDAYHPTMPHPDGMGARLAMERALHDAGLNHDVVDYISAHGTGTPANDKIEATAIREVMGDHASQVAVSSIKSMIGHTMGAASAIEAVACALAIDTGAVPPTINYETPDPECNLDVVPNQSRSKTVTVALNNAYAFGGNNSCVAFTRAA